jgi:hypothetical protein
MRTQEFRFFGGQFHVNAYSNSHQWSDHLAGSYSSEGEGKRGGLLEVSVEADGIIHLVPKLAIDRALAEKYQLADIDWR